MRDYLLSISKIDLLVGAVKIEANHVLGLPLIVSTRRVEPKTSKVMVSKEVSVLAKSRSKEISQKPYLTKMSS